MRGEDQEGRREGRRGREVMSKWSGLGEEGERAGGGERSCRSGVDLARKARGAEGARGHVVVEWTWQGRR